MASFVYLHFKNVIQKHGNIIPIQGDIADRESLLAMAEIVKAKHGYIDLLINNAGIARNLYAHPLPSPTDASSHNHPLSPPSSPTSCPCPVSIKAFQNALWDTGSPDDFAETFATNVTAVYYTTVAFLDLLHQGNIRRRRFELTAGQDETSRPPFHTSQVLSVSSSGSFRLDSKILSTSYTLSKSACTHLGKLLANLLSPWGIRSNVLAPGVWPSGKLTFLFQKGVYYSCLIIEMTNIGAPGVKLDPNALATAVPLRRAGTQEVICTFLVQI